MSGSPCKRAHTISLSTNRCCAIRNAIPSCVLFQASRPAPGNLVGIITIQSPQSLLRIRIPPYATEPRLSALDGFAPDNPTPCSHVIINIGLKIAQQYSYQTRSRMAFVISPVVPQVARIVRFQDRRRHPVASAPQSCLFLSEFHGRFTFVESLEGATVA
jgi:hypothetical protein